MNEWYQFYLRTGALLDPVPRADPFIEEIIRRVNIRQNRTPDTHVTDRKIRHWAFRFDRQKHGLTFDSVMPLPSTGSVTKLKNRAFN